MTTIFAVQHPKGFTIAADSQITDNERPYFHKEVKKITEVEQYVIAGAGNARYTDIIQYGWIPPVYTGNDMYRFLVSQFIPAMRECHERAGYALKKGEGFNFIIGLENQLYYIAEDYSVLRADNGLYALGTGSELALGAYSAGASIREAMKIASKFDVNTGGKIQIVKRGVENA